MPQKKHEPKEIVAKLRQVDELMSQGLQYSWLSELLEVGKKGLTGDTARQPNKGEEKDLRAEALALMELAAVSLAEEYAQAHEKSRENGQETTVHTETLECVRGGGIRIGPALCPQKAPQ